MCRLPRNVLAEAAVGDGGLSLVREMRGLTCSFRVEKTRRLDF
jgi:hypothetical protein